MVQIAEPSTTITTNEVFSSEGTAIQSVASIYNAFTANSTFSFGNGAVTTFVGLSADELQYFGTDQNILKFQNNKLTSDNYYLLNSIWKGAYFCIYQCNSVLEGLNASNRIPVNTKKQLTGEVKFLRAFANFYLTQLYGDIPLVNTTQFNATDNLNRTSQNSIINQIESDLKDAQGLVSAGFSSYGGRRIRATSAAVSALLARVYLFKKDWANAESYATNVINNSDFILDNLNNVFLQGSQEAILQFQIDSTQFPFAIIEAFNFIPFPPGSGNPNYYIAPGLLNAFEPGDLRRKNWVDSTNYQGTFYYYPYKYKTQFGNYNVKPDEYYMVLRLAEQYLIRAEARANGAGTGLSGAISDVNEIRSRAGLPAYNGPNEKDSILKAIVHERQVELFAEWGHRWLDLKRTGAVDAVLASAKPTWSSTARLYPIPLPEILANPALGQNAGY